MNMHNRRMMKQNKISSRPFCKESLLRNDAARFRWNRNLKKLAANVTRMDGRYRRYPFQANIIDDIQLEETRAKAHIKITWELNTRLLQQVAHFNNSHSYFSLQESKRVY